MEHSTPKYQRTIKAIGVFWAFAACMAALAGTTLMWQHTFLSSAWRLNPTAYRTLAPIGNLTGALFLCLSIVLLLTTIGWFGRRIWAWRLAMIVLITQVAGDVLNLLRGDLLRGGTGVAIASALLYFLLRPQLRGEFS